MTLWLTIILAGMLTYAQRLSLISVWHRLQLPPLLVSALRFVPVAVLVALIVPDLLQPAPAGSPLNPRLPAGIVAAVVAWYTRNVTLTIAAGMGALLLLTLLF